MSKVTPAQLRALRVLATGEHMAPRAVALALWPDSIGWKKISRRGSTPAGGALGATMPMKAAQLLWRLRDHGFAWQDENYRWSATGSGLRYLRELDGGES